MRATPGRRTARGSGFDKLFLLSALLALGASAASCRRTPDPADWVRANAIPLAAAPEPGETADLEPLRAIIGQARIVALGEATHGTHEFLREKRRITRFLVEEMGFTVVALEANMTDARAIDEYVRGGGEDAKQALAGLRFWPWYTTELLGTIEWMREANSSRSEAAPVRFAGFDMQQPRRAMVIVRDFFAKREPAYVRELESRYSGAFSAYTLATRQTTPRAQAGMPAGDLAGRRVRFAGWIRTEGVAGGVAALWWRAHDAAGKVIAFDNMEERAPRGTTSWSLHEIALDMPREAARVAFGVMLTGDGTAWFDELTIEADGRRLRPDGIDLGFEGPEEPEGFGLMDVDPRSGLDATAPHGGRACLRLVEDPSARVERARAGLAPALGSTREVLVKLEAMRGGQTDSADEELEWAIQCARLVVQPLEMLAAGDVAEAGRAPVAASHPVLQARDRMMADNVAWIAERLAPGSRIVLWTHNLHASRRPGWMGEHLSRRFGPDYLAVGFGFGSGRYRALGGEGLESFGASAPPASSFERILSAAGRPRFLLDLRAGRDGTPPPGWLTEERPFRAIGPLVPTAQDLEFFPTRLGSEFDVLVWFEGTTPSVPIEG